MNEITKLSTRELNNLIKGVALQALNGWESKTKDELCELAHAELERRAEEAGEYVRLSNLKKDFAGYKAYVCGIRVDGVVVKSFYERDLTKAKSYARV